MEVLETDANLLRCRGPENCGEEDGGYRYCIAARCMAWRKIRSVRQTPEGDIVYRYDEGYCGLAGPEED